MWVFILLEVWEGYLDSIDTGIKEMGIFCMLNYLQFCDEQLDGLIYVLCNTLHSARLLILDAHAEGGVQAA